MIMYRSLEVMVRQSVWEVEEEGVGPGPGIRLCFAHVTGLSFSVTWEEETESLFWRLGDDDTAWRSFSICICITHNNTDYPSPISSFVYKIGLSSPDIWWENDKQKLRAVDLFVPNFFNLPWRRSGCFDWSLESGVWSLDSGGMFLTRRWQKQNKRNSHIYMINKYSYIGLRSM